jgi:hypothetical protein
MTILCPTCEQPMKEYDRAFRCEPCREIIIFFTVSDTSPYITGACFRKRKSPSGAMRVPSNLPGPTPHVSRANPSANELAAKPLAKAHHDHSHRDARTNPVQPT